MLVESESKDGYCFVFLSKNKFIIEKPTSLVAFLISEFFNSLVFIISFSNVSKYIKIQVDGWNEGYLNSYLKSKIGLCILLFILVNPAYYIPR